MGGLGFKDFRAYSEAFLSKWVLKALDTQAVNGRNYLLST
jgi:hypothetical protein